MFTHDTEEKRTGIVKVTDLDFTTVKNAVDFCYGLSLTDKTTAELLNVHAFGDKYDIQVMVKKVSSWVLSNLNPFNFCLILNHAWVTSNDDLKTKCIQYYRDNVEQVALTPEFAELEKEVLRDLIGKSRFLDKTT
uniref:BACK domain-containing protein n=1 Tax=Panagrellus redivivus TaxID=6233 RepID=A0A7E4V3B8_PANRE